MYAASVSIGGGRPVPDWTGGGEYKGGHREEPVRVSEWRLTPSHQFSVYVCARVRSRTATAGECMLVSRKQPVM